MITIILVYKAGANPLHAMHDVASPFTHCSFLRLVHEAAGGALVELGRGDRAGPDRPEIHLVRCATSALNAYIRVLLFHVSTHAVQEPGFNSLLLITL